MTTTMRTSIILLALAGLALAARPARAQAERCEEGAGTLGIQGLRCEGCAFRTTGSGLVEATFRTEPEILAVVPGAAGGDPLRPGDRIVSVDGALITTRAGSDRLVSLREGQRIVLRVRRDGGAQDLRVTAGSACELRRRMERGEVRADIWIGPEPPLPPAPRSPATMTPPAAPAAPGLPSAAEPPGPPALPSLPPLPDAPAPPPVSPDGYLGFGLRCDECWLRGSSFTFTRPPTVEGVTPGGPAQRAGLRSGDVIVGIDGVDITTEEGGRRFGAIQPGQRVDLEVRGSAGVRSVALVAGERPARAPAASEAPGSPVSERLRYEGRIGDTRVQVRGAPVHVTRDASTGRLVIRTSDTVIVLRSGA